MCSGVVFPEVDFHGNVLQTLGDKERILDVFGFALSARGGTPFALFAWLGGRSTACHNFIETLLQLGEGTPDAIARFTLGTFENLFIRPEWFGALEDSQREWIARGMKKYLREDDVPDFSKDDGVKVIDWKVEKIVDLRL